VPALESASDPKMGKWVFIYAGVGDCKAFLWSHSTRMLSDITAQNRGEVLDARDCGGRLGLPIFLIYLGSPLSPTFIV